MNRGYKIFYLGKNSTVFFSQYLLYFYQDTFTPVRS